MINQTFENQKLQFCPYICVSVRAAPSYFLQNLISSSMAVDRIKAVLHMRKEEPPLIQLITKHGELKQNGLDRYITKLKMEELGHEYAVVSIIGPQSSGKSTLLNHLFGTTFQEMDVLKGISQTTVGIWIARATDIEPCTLVIDVEGSDGVERGENNTLFEKQSAIFALAVSDVVLMNMHYKDVGRQQGAGIPLLKIVFENIMKMKIRRKPRLLFVLRDKPNQAPLEILEADLNKSIEKIFDSVPKPEDHENSSLNDFFDVEVTSLPHYEHQQEQFLKEVETLRKRFVNSTSLGGLAGDKTDKVFSSQFSCSITTIWKSIKENKELDLPALKIMVDTVRCDEVVEKSYSDFKANKDWQNLETSVKTGPIVGFGVKLSSIIKTCLSQYDAKVVHFDRNVQIMKRQNLILKVSKCVQSAREEMLKHEYTKAGEAFKRAFESSDHSLGKILVCRKLAMSLFAKGCKEMEIEHMELDASKFLDRVEVDIQNYVSHRALEIANANAEAAATAAIARAAARKLAAEQAAAEAKSAAQSLAAAHAEALVKAAHDAKSATEAQNRVQQAQMAELFASVKANTAAAEARVTLLEAELAAAKQRETERKLRENENKCTIL